MANEDTARQVVVDAPTSSVWLVVYRDYNAEEGFCVRHADGGFYVKRFGGERTSASVCIHSSQEIYLRSAPTAVAQMWALVNGLHKEKGLEVVYIPIQENLRTASLSEATWRVGPANVDSRVLFVSQMQPLLETLGDVRM